MGGKVRVATSDYGAKVIFECADGTFGGVVAVGVWGYKLEVNILFVEGYLHGVGALVVKDVESGGCTMMAFVSVACRPGCSDLQVLAVFENVGVGGVGVVVIEDENVFIPA